MTDFKMGDRVRFVSEQLGTIDPACGNKFTGLTVGKGDLGTVAVPEGGWLEGWLAITPDADESLFVPVHPEMIEAA